MLRRDGSRRLLAGNYVEAVQLYERALAIDGSDVATWNNLGFAYRQQRDLPNAERCYRTALRLEPGNQKALKGLNSLKRA
ncbi:MAG: tetratricopeptide repeat protein [Thermoplasmata archaeon]|nr:tetratricopeptide repeat protein [Thermoplasmata archaeon]